MSLRYDQLQEWNDSRNSNCVKPLYPTPPSIFRRAKAHTGMPTNQPEVQDLSMDVQFSTSATAAGH